MNHLAAIPEKFRTFVVTSDGCWQWNGSIDNRDRARLSISNRWHVAPRMYYQWAKGPIPEGYQIDHLCMHGRCVNPDHLEAVTPAENMRRYHRALRQNDPRTGGAWRKAKRLPRAPRTYAKLNPEMVVAIYADARPLLELAAAYDVSRCAIWEIKTGRTWAKVTGAVAEQSRGFRALEAIKSICKLLADPDETTLTRINEITAQFEGATQ